MARPREGIGFVQHGIVRTGIRVGAQRRTWPVMDTDPPPAGVPLAVPWAKAVSIARQSLYDAGTWSPDAMVRGSPGLGESVRTWAERWCKAREASGLASVGDDRGRLANHILPVIGDDPIATVTAGRIEDVRDALDAKLLGKVIAGATVTKTWGVVTKMFADARRAKDRALRVRTDNPCADIEPPDREAERVGPVLFPSEAVALLTCAKVPQRWRELFALAIYTYARASELAGLTVDAIDLERDTIHVTATLSMHGVAGSTKTGATRRLPIEPAAREFVVALVARAKKTKSRRLVEKMPRREDLAAYLRKCLGYADVTRAELFADNEAQRPISFHDLRATGITWMALRGDDALAIQQRAGHTTFATTQGYVRLASTLGTVGAVFPPVPGFVTGSVTASGPSVETLTTPREKRRPQRDLKASACHELSPSAANCAAVSATCEQIETLHGRFVTGFVTEIETLERWELATMETVQ